jgi:hypothetical protein
MMYNKINPIVILSKAKDLLMVAHCQFRRSLALLGMTGVIVLAGCVSVPPRDVNNICNVFREYPNWRTHALDVQRRWRIPVAVQMAIIHQESKFDAQAKPPRTKLLWFIPWTRPSTAYGYAQALDSTWSLYKKSDGGFWASREDFADGVDFIGWYANQAHRRAGIRPDDAYSLYLAYHEGIKGYQNKTYLRKKWLIQVAHKVSARAQIYQAQLARC